MEEGAREAYGQDQGEASVPYCRRGEYRSGQVDALLDSDSLVPTNAMRCVTVLWEGGECELMRVSRACTAVVTELSYNYSGETIRAEVEFLSADEWRAELHILRDGLIDDEGNCRRVSDEGTEAGAAWARIHSVYPMLHQNAEYGDKYVPFPDLLSPHTISA